MSSLPAKASDRSAALIESAQERRSSLVVPRRLERVVPKRPTRREKRVGRETAYRGTVAEAYLALHEQGSIAIARVIDHAQAVDQATIQSINARVRQVANEEDRMEIAENARGWKAMSTRQQRGLAEAANSNIAELINRPLYQERRGKLAELGDKIFGE